MLLDHVMCGVVGDIGSSCSFDGNHHRKRSVVSSGSVRTDGAMVLWPTRQRNPAPEVVATRGATTERMEATKAPRCRVTTPTGDDDTDVGPISETREEHLRRHGGGRRSCPCCRWYIYGPEWAKHHSCMKESRIAGLRDFIWVAERPSKWGGEWALGCIVCAAAAARVTTGDVE